ncbi:cytochrome P450 [[Mycobacterium] vasticus]|uniref:Cytochrome P450 n=1 Tax=[Mycobacterium] vasticus TaxID=2875777 RepID=A0ABU5YZK6_9MYCO|nr:cytochrome P450 [Mycolicibacter sp. MYC017]MEB3070276.1 cytochrome P450 [Mycolicibacter sp. MYC017]
MSKPEVLVATDRSPVVQFDHHDPALVHDPWPTYAKLREVGPVTWSDAHGGFWAVAGYDEVYTAARDDETFCSGDGVTIPPEQAAKVIPITADPPDLRAYRDILSPLFSPGAAKVRRDEISALVLERIRAVGAQGGCDLVEDIATPVPSIITMRLLGIPQDGWRDYMHWYHDNSTRLMVMSPEEKRAHIQTFFVLRSQIEEVIAARRSTSSEDLISVLVRAEFDGRLLTDEEIINTVSLVLAGGLDTTATAIVNALLFLDEHPEGRERYVTDDQALDTFLEEMLRYEPPVHSLARRATCDVELGGAQIRAGDRLLLLWASANRDAKVFEDPDVMIADRFPNRHMAFGIGQHRCIGSNLARLQTRLVVQEFLRHFPDYRVSRDGLERAATLSVVRGYLRAPVTFTPIGITS